MVNYWLIVPSLLVASFFSGMEHALAASNKLKIELGSRQGRISLQIQYLFLQHLMQFRITMTIGYLLSLFVFEAIFVYSTQSLALSLIGNVFVTLITQVLVATVSVVFFVELLARTIFRVNSNRALTLFSVPAYFCYLIFSPVTWIIQSIIHFVFNGKSKSKIDEVYGITAGDEWLMDSDLNQNNEENGSRELKIFQNALDFSKVRVRDCMIPRTEIEAVDIKTGIEGLWKRFVGTGYSKLIVFSDRIDNIVGYISSKELFKNPANIEEKLNSISFVPETMPASKLLNEFMQYHRSIAVVVDEYGGTSGIVTLEDIIEEIFGEIEDEHDTTDEVEKIVRPNEYVLSCRLDIEYLNSKYELHIPENENYDTLAGYILFHYHNLPKSSEVIEIEKFTFKILKVKKNRIELVYLKVSSK